MTNAMKLAAERVGQSLVAATDSLGDAILHTCAAIISTVEGETATNQLGVMRRESKQLHDALGVIMAARQSQIQARVAALRRAQALKIEGFGESCSCVGAATAAPESVRLAVVA